MNSHTSRKNGVLLTWFSVFLVLSGVFSWIPAAAEDSTPDDVIVTTDPTSERTVPPAIEPPTAVPTTIPTLPPPTVTPTPEPPAQPSSNRESLTTTSLEAMIEVTSVSISCPAAGDLIEGSLTVANAQADASIVLNLVAEDDWIDTLTIDLVEGQSTYAFEFTLDPADFSGITGTDVEVVAEEGASTATPTPSFSGMPLTSEPVSIDMVAGSPACVPDGTVDPGPTPTPIGEPTATPTPTEPDEPATGTVSNTNGSNLRCRAEPNTSAAILGLLPAGSSVEIRGAAANGWVPVRCDGHEGWVSADFLTVTNPPTDSPPPDGTIFATVSNTGSSNLRCRTEPVSGATIVLLPPGTRVEVRGDTSNGWVPIRCADRDGWSSAEYLTLGGSTTPGPTPPQPPVGQAPASHATVSGTGGSNLRCRTAPVSGDTIVLMAPGSRVEIRGAISNGWVPITCAGQAGWASAAYLLFDVGAGSGELWIDINLSTQYMRVFRGNTIIMQTYISSGKNGFITPTGTFYINRKIPSQTMTGTIRGEYYYVPNVPSVMYFTNVGHAIHGAYWHNAFGTRRSHGCINVPVDLAAWLYSITPLGTRVRIHY